MSKDFRKLIQESVKQKQLHPEDIPSLDLYMDQVIALMSEHLGEDGEKEPLTRTMIHNYSKAGVISPIKAKNIRGNRFCRCWQCIRSRIC